MNYPSNGRGQRVGCVRVSSLDQNTACQLDCVRLDRVFEEKLSSKDTTCPTVMEQAYLVPKPFKTVLGRVA